MNEVMLFLHQHKLLVWTVLCVTVLASLSAIHQSFDLTASNYPWRNLDMHDAIFNSNTNTMLRHRMTELRDENEVLKGQLAEEHPTLSSLQQHHQQQIERLQRDLEEAKAAAAVAANSSSSSTTLQNINASGGSALGVSLRLLWEQLVQETPTGQTNQRVLANIKTRSPYPSKNEDIILVTHGSLFKLNIFLTQLEYWNGPASIALYMNGIGGNKDDGTPDGISQFETFLKEHEERLQNTTIHLLMEYTASEDGKPVAYPHNPLRNLAMDHSGSDYIVALDVDFIPGPANCYEGLMAALKANNSSMAKEMRLKKRIMVLPAFEVYAPENQTLATPEQLPATKQELWESVQSNRSETFRVYRYPAGHNPTNFTMWFDPIVNPQSQWKDSTEHFYPVYYRPGFEPYVLAYRPGIPRYWNTFRGFGQNKLSWFMELHRAGYLFGSLWDFFVVHLEHPTTVNWQERHDNLILNEEFLKYLDEQYPLKNNRKPWNNRYFFTFKNKPIKKPSSTTKSKGTTTRNRAVTRSTKAKISNTTTQRITNVTVNATSAIPSSEALSSTAKGSFVDAAGPEEVSTRIVDTEDETQEHPKIKEWSQKMKQHLAERQQQQQQVAMVRGNPRSDDVEPRETGMGDKTRQMVLDRLHHLHDKQDGTEGQVQDGEHNKAVNEVANRAPVESAGQSGGRDDSAAVMVGGNAPSSIAGEKPQGEAVVAAGPDEADALSTETTTTSTAMKSKIASSKTAANPIQDDGNPRIKAETDAVQHKNTESAAEMTQSTTVHDAQSVEPLEMTGTATER